MFGRKKHLIICTQYFLPIKYDISSNFNVLRLFKYSKVFIKSITRVQRINSSKEDIWVFTSVLRGHLKYMAMSRTGLVQMAKLYGFWSITAPSFRVKTDRIRFLKVAIHCRLMKLTV